MNAKRSRLVIAGRNNTTPRRVAANREWSAT
jgi:hypothetical protein